MSGQVVFSPSNLATYRDCPLKFYLQRTGVIKWKPSEAKSRGTQLHEYMESAVKEESSVKKSWPYDVNVLYVQQLVKSMIAMKHLGARVMPEHELVVNKEFKQTGWWDEDAFIRARADVVILTEQQAIVVDYKTGKVYPGQDFQLRMEAMLVHILYGTPKVEWMLAYCDPGVTKREIVDFTKGLSPVADIISLMKEAQGATYFPPKKNKFCRWCDVYHSVNCPESAQW